MESYVNTFRLGTDPEFFLVEHLTPELGGDRLVHFNNGTADGKIASDHGGSVVELRPSPAYTVTELLSNIQVLLKHPTFEPYKKYTWRGGANHCGTYIGGHVHLELPIGGMYNMPQEEYQRRLKACDALVRTVEGLGMYPKAEGDSRRARGYGAFSQVQLAGGEPATYVNPEMASNVTYTNRNIYRMEYRTPQSWMFDPRVAFITIAGIKLAAASPVTALAMLSDKNTDKERWDGLIDFFRAFSAVDSDAQKAAYKLMNSKHLDNLNKLRVDHTKDFKEKWEKWTI